MKNRFLPILFIFSLFTLFSCDMKKEEIKIDLHDELYWAPCDAESSPENIEAQNIDFQKFEVHNGRNIARLVGMKGSYIWLKADFEISPELKNESLGLAISYLHYACKTYLNGSYVGSSGTFPPEERSNMYASSYFSFPEGLLNQDGKNTLLLKVWCHGRSAISDKVFVMKMDEAKQLANQYTANNSRMYIMFEGGMFSAFILFFLVWLRRREEMDKLLFAILNLVSLVFTIPFFAEEVPWYTTTALPHIWFIKLFLCGSMCDICYFLASFNIHYLRIKENKIVKRVRLGLLLFSQFVCAVAPDYDALMAVCPFVMVLCLVHIMFGLVYLGIHMYKRISLKRDIIFLSSFTPLALTIIADFIIKDGFYKLDVPYLTVYGWQLTIVAFFVHLIIEYTGLAKQAEYLNVELENEVIAKTQHLIEVNDRLEFEKRRSIADLEMAAIVQQKYFPYPNKKFRGWDIAICYSPCSKVSGDLYDYYHENDSEDLHGFSLFDVSGHGISSSLITMLAKNIIFRCFKECRDRRRPVSEALYEANDQIIDAKGNVENYLTGLMFRFGNFDEKDEVVIEMANAGHPNPILYSSKSNIIAEIENSVSEPHYGAIGIKDIAVSFPPIDFKMGNDDILVCYTDGLTEAMNSNHEQFGVETVKKIIRDSYAKNAQSILEDIIDGLYEFIGDTPRDDDLTIMVFKREDSQNFIEEL
ncbi:MAG: SpoIIE family protein phosphatase [Treponema sp.]|nr:SpoIIE family protein phosphatase [Candidatus Treponema equifaecale]